MFRKKVEFSSFCWSIVGIGGVLVEGGFGVKFWGEIEIFRNRCVFG